MSQTSPSHIPKKPTNNPLIAVVALVCLVLAFSAVLYRMLGDVVIEGDPVGSKAEGRNGLADFRDAVYWPGKVLAAGTNPYNTPAYMQGFPVGNNFPLFSPLILLVYAPFSALPFSVAATFYVTLNTLLFLSLVALSLRTTQGKVTLASLGFVGAALFISQPGRACFHGGQLAAMLSLVSLFTLWCAKWDQRWSTLGLVLASIKPTFGIPLGFALLGRRKWQALVWGWGIGGVIAVLGLVLIFSQHEGLSQMANVLQQNQGHLNADPDVDPRTTHVRIDSELIVLRAVPSLIGKSWTMLLPLGITFVASWLVLGTAGTKNTAKQSSESGQNEYLLDLGDVFSFLTIALAMYHLIYDALILVPAFCALAFSKPVKQVIPNSWRYVLITLVSAPFVNVLWSPTVMELAQQQEMPLLGPWIQRSGYIWESICLINPVAIFAAWLITGGLLLTTKRSTLISKAHAS